MTFWNALRLLLLLHPKEKRMSSLQIDGRDVVEVIEISGVYDGWSIAITDDGRTWNRWDEIDYPGRYIHTREYMEANGMTDASDAKRVSR